MVTRELPARRVAAVDRAHLETTESTATLELPAQMVTAVTQARQGGRREKTVSQANMALPARSDQTVPQATVAIQVPRGSKEPQDEPASRGCKAKPPMMAKKDQLACREPLAASALQGLQDATAVMAAMVNEVSKGWKARLGAAVIKERKESVVSTVVTPEQTRQQEIEVHRDVLVKTVSMELLVSTGSTEPKAKGEQLAHKVRWVVMARTAHLVRPVRAAIPARLAKTT